MKKIGVDEVVIIFFSEENSLTSSILQRVDIYQTDENFSIDLYFKLTSGKKVKLNFSDIQEYSFFHSSDYIFYNVEILKFFKDAEMIYISLDPIDEQEYISKDDKDYIISGRVEGFLIE